MYLPTADQAQGIALIIGALAAFIVSVGTFVMQYRANKKMNNIREDGAMRTAQIADVHELVNGQSAKLLALTAQASEAKGAKDERDAAETGEHV